MWKKFLMFSACIAGIMLVMIGFAAYQAHAAGKETLTIGMQDDTITLDPAKTKEHVALAIINQVYERLVMFQKDELTEPAPAIAESWTIGDDRKTWTFNIRQNRVFSTGNPINADAVVFSLQRALKLQGDSSWMLTQIGMKEEAITKVDDYTVQIILDQPYAPSLVLACLMTPIASILDPVVLMKEEQNGDMGDEWLNLHSAGSGRFFIAARDPGKTLTLQVNEKYSGIPSVVKTVTIRNIQEPIEQAVALEKGDIDVAWDLLPSEIRRLESNPDIQIYSTPTANIRFVGMNLTYEPLGKTEIRQAIRYAIDYDGIVDYIIEGAGEKIQAFIPKGFLGYNSAMPYTRDFDKAKQLLQQAGYPNGFEVELVCENASPWIDIATQIKSDLKQIGITVTIKAGTFEELINAMFSRQYQMYLIHWESDYMDPDANAKPFAFCDNISDNAPIKAAAWLSSYLDADISSLVQKAALEPDADARKNLYQQITDNVLNNGPYVVLYSPLKQYGVRLEVRDMLGAPSIFFSGFPVLR